MPKVEQVLVFGVKPFLDEANPEGTFLILEDGQRRGHRQEADAGVETLGARPGMSVRQVY